MNISRYIAIEGPIGVGKSSLARLLGERFDSEPIFEEVEENPFLPKFYQDQKTFAFQTQMFFLVSRYKQLGELSQSDLFNRTTICDYIFERDLIFARITLTDHEFGLYHELYNLLSKRLPKPDLTVYLQGDTATLMKRIRKRARAMERTATEQYIDQVNLAFNDFFFSYRQGPLLIINTSRIDFVNNERDLDNLVRKLASEIHATEFYNPP